MKTPRLRRQMESKRLDQGTLFYKQAGVLKPAVPVRRKSVAGGIHGEVFKVQIGNKLYCEKIYTNLKQMDGLLQVGQLQKIARTISAKLSQNVSFRTVRTIRATRERRLMEWIDKPKIEEFETDVRMERIQIPQDLCTEYFRSREALDDRVYYAGVDAFVDYDQKKGKITIILADASLKW